MEAIFWINFLIVFYSYVGYGIIIFLLVRIKKIFHPVKKETDNFFFPSVAVIVAAYNEADYIEEKIKNTFALNYPKDKLELVFITDGSTDETPGIIKKYPDIKLLHQPERKGKVAAINRSLKHVTSAILVFCDANTLLNKECIREVVKHYHNPKVGGVAGEKKIFQVEKKSAATVGEGIYWKYESLLKKLDSDLYTTVGAAGELFSVRKELFDVIPDGVIIEDFVQSLRLCIKGYVVRYEPNAFAIETASASVKEEMKRKIRICAGAFQAMILLKELFNIFKYPIVSFQFISHRILRWTLCPISLIIMLLTNTILVVHSSHMFYEIILVAQVFFYVMAITGWIYANRNIRIKILYIPFYFLFMNMAVFMGFKRFLQKKQSVLWEKASRQKVA